MKRIENVIWAVAAAVCLAVIGLELAGASGVSGGAATVVGGTASPNKIDVSTLTWTVQANGNGPLIMTDTASRPPTAPVVQVSSSNGTNFLYIESDGRTGIGTTSPATVLDVNGASQFGSGATKSTFSATGDLTLDVGASMQVGTTSILSNVPLNVVGSNPRIRVTGATYSGVAMWSNAAGANIRNWQQVVNTPNDGDLTFQVGASVGAAPATDIMTLARGGNVGIGTTSPGTTLDVNGGSTIRGQETVVGSMTVVAGQALTDPDVAHGMTFFMPTDQYGRFSPLSGTTGGLDIVGMDDTGGAGDVGLLLRGYHGATDPADGAPAVQFRAGKKSGTDIGALGAAETAYQFADYNTGNLWLNIMGDGKVGIGTTSPGTVLDVNGGSTIRGQETVTSTVTIQGNAFSVGGSTLVASGGSVAVASSVLFTTAPFHAGGGGVFDGNLTQKGVKSCTLGTTTDAAGMFDGCVASDISLKKNIKPLVYNPALIDALIPITYEWKNPSRGTGTKAGFIAQSVEKVYKPAVVSAGVALKGVESNALIAALVAEVQALRKRVAALETSAP